MQNNNIYKIYLQLTLSQFFWAGSFVAGQIILFNQPPIFTALLRSIFCSLGYVIIWLYVTKFNKLRIPTKSSVWSLIAMGFFGVFLYSILIYCGLKRTTAISASLLIPTTQPIFTTLLATFFYKERLEKKHIIGLVLGLVGAASVMTGTWSLKHSINEILGNILLLAGALVFSIYSLFGKMALKELGSLETVTYSTIIGTLLLLPLAIISDASIFNFKTAGSTFWIGMFYTVFFSGILPYLWWYSGVKILGASKTAAITFLLPPFALILAAIILHQEASFLQIMGGALGLIGVIFATGFSSVLREKFFIKRVQSLQVKD